LDLEDNELLDKIDFIISTIPLSLEKVDVIVVNPFLNDSDIKKIKTYLRKNKIEYGIFSEKESDKIKSKNQRSLKQKNNKYQAEEIIEILKPYLKKDKLQAALTKIEKHFEPARKIGKNKKQPKKSAKGLLKLLKKDQIEIIKEEIDWKKAITRAGELLLDKDLIEAKYINRMIEIVEDKGPYIAIAPEICLAHAGVEDGVKKSAISLLVIKDGIKLGHQFDPIKFVFVLAPIDKKGHMPALTDIMEFANNGELMEEVAAAKSEAAAYKILKDNFSQKSKY
jgi:mannitol/fructose-specific phosphotransferase system IIA component (Ntr-type)